MARACIVADDLTGAADTGVQFAAAGPAYVLLPWTDLARAFSRYPAEAYAIDTASRSADAATARARTFRALSACASLNPGILYLKVDSTLRGHVGPALAGMRACFPDRPVPVACAFPETGRTTANAVQFVHGTPVDAHEMGKDALAPVSTAHLPSLLEGFGSSRAVPLDAVRSSRIAAYLDAAQRDGADFVVIDAETRDDLDRIAAALLGWRTPVACAGSGGLAGSLAKAGFSSRTPEENGPPRAPAVPPGPALIATTSLKSVTAAQLDALATAFPETVRCELRPVRDSAGPGWRIGDVEHIADEACRALDSGRNAVVHAAFDAPVDPDLRPPLLEAIAAIVQQAHARARVALTIAVGGDTAAAVLRRLDAEGIKLESEIVPGVVLGAVAGGPRHGAALITKAGGFGTAQTLVSVLEMLRGTAN